MPLDGFNKIWKELQKIAIDEELQRLDELAQYDLSNNEGRRLFQYHYKKHGKPLGMTEQEYKKVTDILTSMSSVPFSTTNKEYDVVGYVAQNGRNVKFIRLINGAALGVYEGDAINGTAIDYYHDKNINDTFFRANPFRRLTKNAEDLRYKSDLDGKFIGLNYFKPIFNQKSNVHITQDEYNTIRQEILSGKKISIR